MPYCAHCAHQTIQPQPPPHPILKSFMLSSADTCRRGVFLALAVSLSYIGLKAANSSLTRTGRQAARDSILPEGVVFQSPQPMTDLFPPPPISANSGTTGKRGRAKQNCCMFEIFVTGLKFIFVTKLANFAEPCKKPATEALGKDMVPYCTPTDVSFVYRRKVSAAAVPW